MGKQNWPYLQNESENQKSRNIFSYTVFTLRSIQVRYGTVRVDNAPGTRSHTMAWRPVPATFDLPQCVRLLEMSLATRRPWAFLALRASLEAEKRLNAFKSKRLRRAHAIRRRLRALQRKQKTRRLSACMVVLSLSLMSTQIIRSVWTIPRYMRLLAHIFVILKLLLYDINSV